MRVSLRWICSILCLSVACSDETPTTDNDALTNDPGPLGNVTPVGSSAGNGSNGGGPVGIVAAPMPEDPGDSIIEQSENDRECKPTTCAAEGFNCGFAPDNCGGTLDCGSCPAGQLCGGETPNICLAPPACEGASSCAELGWECGVAVDDCGNTFDCAAEGLACNELETCIAGDDGKTVCQPGLGGATGCDVCDGIVDCEGQAQATTLSGRVITPGRTDDNVANQVGVPNAFVYILTNNNPDELPAFVDGIPDGQTACDRCEGQDLGPVLVGATTDALGYFTLQGNVPVGVEFLLVVKVGRFRRAIPVTVPEASACATTELDMLETRLPRSMDDGLGVNIPRIAISTGRIDAMECVFEKMGISHGEFNVPGDGTNPERIHLYGTDGAEMPEGNPPDDTLFDDLGRVNLYDMLVFDCQGPGYTPRLDPPPATALDNIREYVNRGGRMFASHLSFQWICRNGDEPYSADDPIATGLAPSADFPGCTDGNQGPLDGEGVGIVSSGRPQANAAKIEDFATWLVNENAATMNADGLYEFPILEPRNLASSVSGSSEEFVYRGDATGTEPPVQQYAFNTPFGAPEEASCGRVSYSGFHVSASGVGALAGGGGGLGGGGDDGGGDVMAQGLDTGAAGAANDDMPMGGGGGPGGGGGGITTNPFQDSIFPEHCEGDLTAQEKVLLWLLFDLGACVGDPPDPPECAPTTCEAVGAECGLISDGCGMAVDCGPCPEGEVCGLIEPNQCAACVPKTCDEVEIECGVTGDGCGGTLECTCPPGLTCGFATPNKCGSPDTAN